MQPVPLSQRDINKTLNLQVSVPIPGAYLKFYESVSWFWGASHRVDEIASSLTLLLTFASCIDLMPCWPSPACGCYLCDLLQADQISFHINNHSTCVGCVVNNSSYITIARQRWCIRHYQCCLYGILFHKNNNYSWWRESLLCDVSDWSHDASPPMFSVVCMEFCSTIIIIILMKGISVVSDWSHDALTNYVLFGYGLLSNSNSLQC